MCLMQLIVAAFIGSVTPSSTAATLTGQYVEVRTCDIWTAACFANAEINLTGKHAIMAWKVNEGAFENVNLTGLSVVALVAAQDTLGQAQTGPARSVLIIDDKADAAQREALLRLAKNHGGALLDHVAGVQFAPVELSVSNCEGGACARMTVADVAHLETRCIDADHDKACGSEGTYYPPLTKLIKAQAAVAVEHGYSGKDLNLTWKESDRRGAYVGSFEAR